MGDELIRQPSDCAAHLQALRASLEGLRWRLPLLFAGLALLAVALLFGAEVAGLLPAGLAGRWALLVAAAAVIAGLLMALASVLIWRPIRQAFDDTLRLQRSVDAQLERRMLLRDILLHLQQAQGSTELARLLLSELARCLPLDQALCCYWDEASGTLGAVARYAGAGADAAAVAASPALGALLLEVARQRKPVAIERPGAGFLRVTSGLGDAEPAELMLHPVVHRGQLFAVLELASLQPLGAAARGLLDEIAPLFAANLDLLQRSERLLAQARVAGQPGDGATVGVPAAEAAA